MEIKDICGVDEQILPIYIKASLFQKIWYIKLIVSGPILLDTMIKNIL